MYFRKNWIFFIKFHIFWFFFFFFVWIFSNIIHIYDLSYLCIDCNICLHWNHCLRIYVTIWNFYEKEREKVGESERDTVKGWERMREGAVGIHCLLLKLLCFQTHFVLSQRLLSQTVYVLRAASQIKQSHVHRRFSFVQR